MIEPPEPVHTGHNDTHSSEGGWRWFDLTMAVAVLLVSAGSLYVALHTGKTMEALVDANERLVRSQSTPILQYDHGNANEAGEDILEFSLTNNGTGPARIVWFEVTHNGTRYRLLEDWIRSMGKGPAIFTSGRYTRIVLAPGESRNMISWRRPKNLEGLDRWNKVDRERFATKVRACYCSVFDQCWQSDLEADSPEEVSDCGRPNTLSASLLRTGA